MTTNILFWCISVVIVLCALVAFICHSLYKNVFNDLPNGCNGSTNDSKESKTQNKSLWGKFYVCISIFFLLLIILIVLIIECLFRIEWVQQCESSFSAEDTVQIVIGVSGVMASILLSVIAIIYSKSEAHYNSKRLEYQDQHNKEIEKEYREEIKSRISLLREDFIKADVERLQEIKRKRTKELIQQVQEFFNAMSNERAYIFDRTIQWKKEYLNIPVVTRYIAAEQQSICFAMLSGIGIPAYIGINLKKITFEFQNKSICNIDFDIDRKNGKKYEMGYNSVSIYIPNDTEGAEELALFRAFRNEPMNQYCKCVLHFNIYEKYVSEENSAQTPLQVCFNIEHTYDDANECLSTFAMRNITFN